MYIFPNKTYILLRNPKSIAMTQDVPLFCLSLSIKNWTPIHEPRIGHLSKNFPGGSDGKASAYNAGDPGSTLSREDPLEKEMATHWKIRWTEEHGRLQSMGSQRVGHD